MPHGDPMPHADPMPHVDSDTLALIALGEPAAGTAEQAHLADCEHCAARLAELSLVTRLGRDSFGDQPLSSPRPEVWAGIAAELGLAGQSSPRPVRARRRLVPVLAAAAAVVALAAAGVTGWQLLRPAPPEVLATARLDAFPEWPGASGQATVERMPDGSRVVRLTLATPEERGDFREAWLITQDASALVSLGVVDASTAVLAIPDGIDLARYDLVDVSAESYDGDPAHSGDSIVRGRLAP